MERQKVDVDFSNKIVFSNEAHFNFDGSSQPDTVCCEFSIGGVIARFILENAADALYRDMII